MKNIQVFLSFANFYGHFIQGFSKIAKSFTLMLKTTWLAKNLSLLITKNIEISSSGSDCKDKTVKRSLSKNLNRAINYLIFNNTKII